MNFERFLDINIKDDNSFIVFKDNKILYEPELKTFLLDGKFLDIDFNNSTLIGIAKNNDTNIYGLDITKCSNNINIGYKDINELDTRHLLSILKPDEIVLMGRANQLLHWIKSNKYSGYSGELNKFDSKEQSLFCPTSSAMIYPSISPCVLAMVIRDDEIRPVGNAPPRRGRMGEMDTSRKRSPPLAGKGKIQVSELVSHTACAHPLGVAERMRLVRCEVPPSMPACGAYLLCPPVAVRL